MRVVYEPEIIGRLEKAISDAYKDARTIARFELNPYEMNELKKWSNRMIDSSTIYFPREFKHTGMVTFYKDIPVIEKPFTYFTDLPSEETANG